MANLNIIMSYTFKDDSAKKKSVQLFQTVADTTSLASLGTILDTMAGELDAVSDAQIVVEKITVIYPATGGIKSSPVSGSNDEETGLLVFPLDGLPERAFGVDVPAWKDSLTVSTDHNLIDLTAGAVSTLTGDLDSGAWKNEDWSHALATVKQGIVTFRKLRRQLARRRR